MPPKLRTLEGEAISDVTLTLFLQKINISTAIFRFPQNPKSPIGFFCLLLGVLVFFPVTKIYLQKNLIIIRYPLLAHSILLRWEGLRYFIFLV